MLIKAKLGLKEFLHKVQHGIENIRSEHPIAYAVTICLIACLTSFLLEKCLRTFYNRCLKASLIFSFQRWLLIGVVTEICFFAFAYGKKSLNFIYKYRYLLGAGLFILCVIMRVNYSSAGVLDGVIQPHYITQTDDILTGINRNIRSDEYIVVTPMTLSQYRNNYSLVNPDIMADDVITSFYPKLPNKTLLSVLTSPQYLGFMFLPSENAFSFYQLLPWFVAFFAVFEMLMIITKKRKLMSLIGSLVIIFSPVILWFDSVQYIMYVALLFDIFYLYLNHGKTWKSKLAFSVLFGWVAACFVMIIYPAWQVPYGYILLALLISMLVEKRKLLKKQDLLYILPVICVVAALVIPNVLISLDQYKLTTQTVYPGQRSEAGGGGLSSAFYYISSLFFPIREGLNPCEASGFIGLFPIPILLGLYIIFRSLKKKQSDPLLITLVVLSLFFCFMFFIGNSLIAKVTLLFLTPIERLRPVLDLTCLLIIIRLLSSYQTAKPPKRPALLSLAVAVITAVLVYLGTIQIDAYAGGVYMRPMMICAAFVIYYILIYCLIDKRKETSYVIGAVAVLLAGYQFLTIHPLRIGLDVYTDKPVAQRIRELSAEDQDALWLTSGSTLSQYALTNDARVINSINYYPTIDRWRTLDPDGKYDDVYNRYAHISIKITKQGPTHFTLIAPDAFSVDLNYQDICLLHPTYFLSDTKYDSIPGWSQKLIYDEDGVYIYRFDCSSDQ